MRTLFIADLHLSENHPKITNAFYAFLDNEKEDVDALYILGDMFEVWIGDDEQTPLMNEVAKRLTDYSISNQIEVYYVHGNRDFMLGSSYAMQSSMQLLEDHCLINLYGKNTLIMHGDTLCLADRGYQLMRKVFHNALLQATFNLLPLSLRKKIGWKIRSASLSKKKNKDYQAMGVTHSEVIRLMEKHKALTLIHGHTHQVAEHSFSVNQQAAIRIDVGDWSNRYSFLQADKEQLTLIYRPIS